MDQQTGSGLPKWIWLVLVVVGILVVGMAIWFFTNGSKAVDTPTQKTATVYTPKHEDWAVYKSAKYGYNLSHPVDYVLGETGDKSINLTQGDKIKVELYVSSAPIESAVALYTDETKGYMTGGQAESVTIAGTTGKKVTGTFGKFGGNRMAFDGIKGSTTIFQQGDWTYFLNSYDNAEATALTNYNDIAADLVF